MHDIENASMLNDKMKSRKINKLYLNFDIFYYLSSIFSGFQLCGMSCVMSPFSGSLVVELVLVLVLAGLKEYFNVASVFRWINGDV
jgi:hypothetical protein